jgi:hypothetical protein
LRAKQSKPRLLPSPLPPTRGPEGPDFLAADPAEETDHLATARLGRNDRAGLTEHDASLDALGNDGEL